MISNLLSISLSKTKYKKKYVTIEVMHQKIAGKIIDEIKILIN